MTSLETARSTARTLASFAWYPCLLALTWELQYVTAADLDPVAAYRSLAILALMAITITLLVRIVVPSAPIAGAVACIVVLGLLKATSMAAVVVFIAGAALLLLEFQMESRGRLHLPWPRIHEALTIVAAAILAVQVASYGFSLRDRPSVSFDPAWSAAVRVPSSPPNIYIIVADAHGRPDVLRDAYGYDPGPFVARLEALGFEVAGSSRANYLFTNESFASFFAGDHLEHMGLDMDRGPDPAFLAAALDGSPAISLLHRLGYLDVDIPSGYDHVAERNVDVNLDTGQLSHLEYKLMQASQLNMWLPRQLDAWWLLSGESRTEMSLDRLEDIASSRGGRPRLLVVHLPKPHPPYVFDENCEDRALDRFSFQAIDPDGSDVPVVARLAGQQNRCIDAMLAESMTTVVAADPTAVVILMSDHGPDVRMNWSAPAQPGLNDRSANLFAARTLGQPRLFPDDITLVNVLPRLFNAYFGTALPLRPDDVYVSQPAANGGLVKVANP